MRNTVHALSLRGDNADSCSIRMLGDPSYSQVVRWGDEEDSFVVLEVHQSAGVFVCQSWG